MVMTGKKKIKLEEKNEIISGGKFEKYYRQK